MFNAADRRCVNCVYWDRKLSYPDKETGVLHAQCEKQERSTLSGPFAVFTRGSDTCSQWKKGRKEPQHFGDFMI